MCNGVFRYPRLVSVRKKWYHCIAKKRNRQQIRPLRRHPEPDVMPVEGVF